MARSRDLRPEFFTDERVGDLPFGARLLFQGIWVHSDFRGVFEYSAKQLRGLVFPFDEGLTGATVQEWLNALEDKRMIVRFETQDESGEVKQWGYVRSWSEHQSISTREKDIGTKRPAPPSSTPKQYPSSTRAVPEQRHANTQASSPSPSPSPALSPSPSPAPSAGDEDAAALAEDIMATDKATIAKISTPMQVSWLDWRQGKRLWIARTGEDGDMDAWKALWAAHGLVGMDAMYAALIGSIPEGKRLGYSQASEWFAAPPVTNQRPALPKQVLRLPPKVRA